MIVTGKIRAEQRAPGGYEIGVTKINVVQKVDESNPYPIQLKEHGVDFLLDHRHLWMRTPRQAAFSASARKRNAPHATTWTARAIR